MSATTAGAAPRPRRMTEERVAGALAVAVCLVLVVAILLPLWALLSRSMLDAAGRFVGLANYARYFASPALLRPLLNSLIVAGAATALVLPLAFAYAYALTRSRIPARGLFYALALLPIFAPSLLPALSLIYVFGNQGLLRDALPGGSIYGPVGIVAAQVFHCFPPATMVLLTALSLADARLFEAAEALGTSRWRVFRTVTLPGARYGLVSAATVVFTLVVTDFGIAKVIGGNFAVLATDAYKQIVGQQNFEMGAVVGVVLLLPAVLAFVVDRVLRKRQVAALSARAVPYIPQPRPARDWPLLAYCAVVGGGILGLLGVAAWASFIKYWPYDLSPTLAHYRFADFDADGWEPYWNTLLVAGATAALGTVLVFLGAYLTEKIRAAPFLRGVVGFLALLPMAVPGLVLGLGYVFFFNAPGNPLGFLYGTLAILVLNCVAHAYTVAHVTAATALKALDAEFEAVSASLRVPFWTTLRRVTLPICLPAVLDVAIYLFVSAMTTVSAVVFLYGPGTKLASVSIVHMDEAGALASAAGMATCIVGTSLLVKLLHLLLDRALFRRAQRWKAR